MFSRLSPALIAIGGSVLLLAGLIGSLYWISEPGRHDFGNEPLEIYCAETMRVPLEEIAAGYEKEYQQKVVLHPGPSQTILANLELNKKGDLFIPADESFMRIAKKKKLVSAVEDVARMRMVVIVNRGYPKKIASWNDFVAPGIKIGLGNTDATAIGKLIKERLQADRLWDAVEKRDPVYLGSVSQVRNSVQLGSVDVGVVWDVIAKPFENKLTVVRLPEFDKMEAVLQIGLANSSTQPANARRFARYLRAKDKGAAHLKKCGFSKVEEGYGMDERPELLVYAGAMLRPAVEESLAEFKKREHVEIKTVYNGCGILVSAMKAGDKSVPDVYFSCDTSFMNQVKDLFNEPTSVSSNQLMIIVKKGNPKKATELLDLAQPGLRVGVGHEQQCAFGAITKETFLRTGVYAKVAKNITVQTPTGDMLINQLRTGSLDVVVAYRSNLAGFENELEGTPITGIPCAAPLQPIAVSKNAAHPLLSRHLLEFLESDQSRQHFEKLGFGWELKVMEK